MTPHTMKPLPVILSLALAALAGCRGDREDSPPREFFPDLDTQMKWNPQAGADFFPDGRTMRKPVPGTVPFGRVAWTGPQPWETPAASAAAWNTERDDLFQGDELFVEGITGRDAAGAPVYTPRIPRTLTVDMAFVERGRERFNIYCSACHGYMGDGKGTVGVLFNPIPSNLLDTPYTDPAKATAADGYIYKTIRHGKVGGDGKQTMPPYAHALSPRDAWAVVAYVRALQASRRGTLQDAPQQVREQLERTRPAAAPGNPAGTAAPPTTNPGGTP